MTAANTDDQPTKAELTTAARMLSRYSGTPPTTVDDARDLDYYDEADDEEPAHLAYLRAAERWFGTEEGAGSDNAASDTGDEATEVLDQLVDGASFILDTPDIPTAVWGEGKNILWADGEALIIAGVSGVGKTTIAAQLVSALLGFRSSVLGLPVRSAPRVLVLAMDRPAQAARAFARIFSDDDREVLEARLTVWRGPPLADFALHPDSFLALCAAAGLEAGDAVVVDSLKDAAVGLSEDRVGAGYNRARGRVIAEGINVLELHHLVKRGADGNAPKSLADIYGSAHIVNGAGSVVVLHGESGDPIVRLLHLKQPMSDVGPLTVMHAPDGTSNTNGTAHDVVEIVKEYGVTGATADDAAVLLFDTARPTAAHREKARRRLDKAVDRGVLVRTDGTRGADPQPTRWHLAARPGERESTR